MSVPVFPEPDLARRERNKREWKALLDRCESDPNYVKRLPRCIRDIIGCATKQKHEYLPIRKNVVWKVRRAHMSTDKRATLQHYENTDIVLVPMRIDDDGTYFVKLSDTRSTRPVRHWIEVKLLVDQFHEPARSKPPTPVLSTKQVSDNSANSDPI